MKKAGVLLLSGAAVMLTLTGCGRLATIKEEEEITEYMPMRTDLKLEGDYVRSAAACGDILYLDSVVRDGAAETAVCRLYKYDMAAEKLSRLPVKLEKNENIEQIVVSPEGKLLLLISADHFDTDQNATIVGYTQNWELRELSGEDGRVQAVRELKLIDGQQADAVQQFGVDGKGNYYFYNGADTIHVVDSAFKKICDIPADAWVNQLVTSGEGDVYAAVCSNCGNVLQKINLKTGMMGAQPENMESEDAMQNYYAGRDGSILGSGRTVTRYGASRPSEELFDWMDMDVDEDTIEAVGELPGGGIWALCKDDKTDKEEQFQLVFVKKARPSEVTAKKEIVFGTSDLDGAMKKQILAFNRSNKKYHIAVKNHVGMDGADIVDLSHAPYEEYAEKGLLEDLYPYMEKSEMKKEEYLGNILEAYTIKGKLCGISPRFYIQTALAKQSLAGENSGWTLNEMLDSVSRHNPEHIFVNETKNSILYYCIYNDMDEFMNWNTGECNFDQAAFIKILKTAARFRIAEGMEEDAYAKGPSEQLRDGEALLMPITVSSLQDYHILNEMSKEKMAYIGYPDSGRKGNLIQPYGGFLGISASSQNKEGAWEFLKSILSEEYQESGSFDEEINHSFPVKSSSLDKLLEKGRGAASPEEAEELKKLIASSDKLAAGADEQIITIISEETEACFGGKQSAEETAAAVQNRIRYYMTGNAEDRI